MPYHLDETYWSGDADYYELMQFYNEELVPSFGEADTMEGELLRAINQLVYDHYNNGSCNTRTDHSNTLVALSSRFDSETVENIELIDEALNEVDNRDVFYLEDHFSESYVEEFERALENVMDSVVEYIFNSENIDMVDVENPENFERDEVAA